MPAQTRLTGHLAVRYGPIAQAQVQTSNRLKVHDHPNVNTLSLMISDAVVLTDYSIILIL